MLEGLGLKASGVGFSLRGLGLGVEGSGGFSKVLGLWKGSLESCGELYGLGFRV